MNHSDGEANCQELIISSESCLFSTAEPATEFVSYYNDSAGEQKSCSAVDVDNFMHFLRPVNVGSGDLPWTGLLTGMFIRFY